MFNIVYFSLQLNDQSSPAYNIYKALYSKKLLSQPVIYTDKNNIFINDNIPVFSTYYIRHHFDKPYIILDYQDLNYISEKFYDRCLVIYNKLLHNINNKNVYAFISSEDDVESILKDKLYEKV